MILSQSRIQPIRYSAVFGPERAKKDSRLPEGLVLPRFQGGQEGEENRFSGRKTPPFASMLIALGLGILTTTGILSYMDRTPNRANNVALKNAASESTNPRHALACALGMKPDSQDVPVEKLRMAFVHRSLKEEARAIYLSKTNPGADPFIIRDIVVAQFQIELFDKLYKKNSTPKPFYQLPGMLERILEVDSLEQLINKPEYLKGFGGMFGVKRNDLSLKDIIEAFEALSAKELNEVFHFE